MNCPLCVDETLDVAYHDGIEIDICPRCRGVWLDRGELEKLAGSKPAAKSGKQIKRASVRDNAESSEDKPGKSKKKKRRERRKKSLGSRLGDVLEEVLDL